MLERPLAPYLLWAKTRPTAAIDLAGSNVLACSMDDLPGARDVLDLSAPNDLGFAPVIDAIAAHYGVSADRVATAAGCSGANFLVIAALVGAGDRVLVERPTYDPLIGACRLMGADVVRFERRFSDGYGLDLDGIRRQLATSTRLIVLTSPHNPSGTRLTPDAIAAIGAIADAAGAHVLVDEVYLDAASIVRRERPGQQSAAALDGPFVVTSSLTKSYGLAGLRCGWAIAPPGIAERLRRTRDLVDNIAAGPADRLAALAFAQLPRLAARTRAILSTNLDRAARFLAAQTRLELSVSPAASIMFPRLRGASDAGAFVTHLFERYGVAVAPGEFFDAPDHIRISLAADPAVLDRGLTQMTVALADWRED